MLRTFQMTLVYYYLKDKSHRRIILHLDKIMPCLGLYLSSEPMSFNRRSCAESLSSHLEYTRVYASKFKVPLSVPFTLFVFCILRE